MKPKVNENAFDDLLSSQGFSATSRIQANQSLGELKRTEEIKDMDPVSIRIRDWTKGKERNIRALLGSLKDVLWEGADKWDQPNISQLYTANEVRTLMRMEELRKKVRFCVINNVASVFAKSVVSGVS